MSWTGSDVSTLTVWTQILKSKRLFPVVSKGRGLRCHMVHRRCRKTPAASLNPSSCQSHMELGLTHRTCRTFMSVKWSDHTAVTPSGMTGWSKHQSSCSLKSLTPADVFRTSAGPSYLWHQQRSSRVRTRPAPAGRSPWNEWFLSSSQSPVGRDPLHKEYWDLLTPTPSACGGAPAADSRPSPSLISPLHKTTSTVSTHSSHITNTNWFYTFLLFFSYISAKLSNVFSSLLFLCKCISWIHHVSFTL